jgi:hypothetical protein
MDTTIVLPIVLKKWLGVDLDLSNLKKLRNQDIQLVKAMIEKELTRIGVMIKGREYSDAAMEEIVDSENIGLIVLTAEPGLSPKYLLFRGKEGGIAVPGKGIPLEVIFAGNDVKIKEYLFGDFVVSNLDRIIRDATGQNYRVNKLYEIPSTYAGSSIFPNTYPVRMIGN